MKVQGDEFMDYSVVWFRHDLRVTDHEPLVQAVASGLEVMGVYCFDPREFTKTKYGFLKTGVHRAQFLRESIADLQNSLAKLGYPLHIEIGEPEIVLKKLAKVHTIKKIFYSVEVASEEMAVENAVKKQLPHVTFHAYDTHNLIHPADLPFSISQLPDVFTQFRKIVEKQCVVRTPLDCPKGSTKEVEKIPIPTLQELGIHETPPAQPIEHGGEQAGLQRIQSYFFDQDALCVYKETRNGMLRRDDSSKLSSYLAYGCLSPRTIYAEIQRYEKSRIKNRSTYWLFFELLWRDYFSLVHRKYGNRLFQAGGIDDLAIPWSQDEGLFEKWLQGETDYPLVDANMKELQQTGYMSNRGRQNVASFLTKNLGIDWRMGAAWFESQLIDYDVSSNYGNWCYVAGVGNDAREFRVFNVAKQGKDYDPKAQYAKRWLPILKDVPAHRVYTTEPLTDDEQKQYGVILGIDYAAPIVDLFSSANEQKQKYLRAVKKD